MGSNCPFKMNALKLQEYWHGDLLALGVGLNILIVSLTFFTGLTIGLALVGLTAWLIIVHTPVDNRQFVSIALFVALGAKIALAFLYQSYLFTGELPLFAPDGEVYSKFGWYISRIFLGKDFNSLPSAEYVYWNYDLLVKNYLYGELPPYSMYQVGPFTYFLGYLYAFFGYSPVLARIMNTMLSTVSAFLIMRIVDDLAGDREAKLAFVVVLFWPSMFLFSISILRDPAIIFGIVLVVWSIHHLLGGRPLVIVGLLVGMGLVYVLRWQTAWLLLAVLLIWGAERLLRLRKALILGAVVCVLLLGLGRAEPFLKNRMARLVSHHAGYQKPAPIGSYQGVSYNILPPPLGPGAMADDLAKLSWLEMGKIYFRGVAHYLTEPWPSHLSTRKLKIFFPQMVLWYASLILAVPGIFVLWRKSMGLSMLILLFLLLFVSIYGLSEGNIGTLIRHRDMITPLVLILAVMGVSRFFGRVEEPCKV